MRGGFRLFEFSRGHELAPAGSPSAPSALTATAVSPSRIDLAWMDDADNETGFRIERCQGQGCNQFTEIASTGAGVVTFSDSGLGINNGHDLAHDHENEYSYRIRAIAQTTTPR